MLRMNLEVDLLKKEIQYLKNEINTIKYHIFSEKQYSYYKITLVVVQDSPFHVQDFIKTINDKFIDSKIHYTYSLAEDKLYYTPLIPDFHVINTNITIYIHLNTPQLPNNLTESINFPIKLYEYKNIESYNYALSKDPNLILYSN